MASNQIILVLFCGAIWKSLSTAAPGPSLHQPGPALAVTTPAVPTGEEEAGDGSWVAGLLIGIILLGMIVAILVILLWKCCLRPGPALSNSHWAGRSPFADGDTPELFLDSDQDNKRSSVLFMLPWKLKQGPSLQQDPTGSENPSHHTTSNDNEELPAPAGTAAPSTEPPPAPSSQTLNTAADSWPHPDAPPESHDLPPPPDWLREPPEDPSSDPSKHSAFPSAAEEPLPPAPELLIQDIQEPLPPAPELLIQDIPEPLPPAPELLIQDIHKPLPPAPELLLQDIHEPLPPAPELLLQDIHKPLPPAPELLIQDIHEPLPPAPELLIQDIHEPLPPAPELLIQDIPEPLPPAPELLLQDTHEPLPQPEHPLETATSHLQNTPHSS